MSAVGSENMMEKYRNLKERPMKKKKSEIVNSVGLTLLFIK